MYKRLKNRLLQARPKGSLINYFLFQLRTLALWIKGKLEALQARLYFLASKSEADMLRPDFLVAGMQKSATSWLDKMLRCHPALYLPPNRKEVHYWDKFQGRGLSWYLYHFVQAQVDQRKGEVTPGYSILPLAEIRRLFAFNPKTKIIFLLRNPIERAWSQIYMDVVRHPGRDFAKVDAKAFSHHFKRPAVIGRGDYETILTNWRSVFPEDQIFIAYYEEVRRTPEELLNRIFRFLEVQTCEDFSSFPLQRKVNQNSAPAIPSQLKEDITSHYKTRISELAEYLDHPIPNQWLEEIS